MTLYTLETSVIVLNNSSYSYYDCSNFITALNLFYIYYNFPQ